MLELDDSVAQIAGVGPRRAEELRAAGILTVGDLLMYLPMRYEDRASTVPIAELKPGMRTGVMATVLRVDWKGPPGPRRQVEARIEDESGEIVAVWFNQPYVAGSLEIGEKLQLFGRVDQYREQLQIVNPVMAAAEPEAPSLHVGRPVPVYRRIGSLGPGMLRRLVASTLDALAAEVDRLPQAIRAGQGLLSTADALREVHYPPLDADLSLWEELRSEPHRALVTSEFVDFQVVLSLQRRKAVVEQGVARTFPAGTLDSVLAPLPFRLTGAQGRVLDEVMADLASERPMHRLVQGDVGCGKTAVLGAAAMAVARGGEQVAVLAPTEILARQHEATLGEWGRQLGVAVVALTGADPRPHRRDVLARCAAGEPMILVGTHALLEPDVDFARLGLVVIDEQHRFGVGQRAALRAKGKRQGVQPDLLVTTATPIPRSLALTLYGDLDASRVDEMPPGRVPVGTTQAPFEGGRELVSRLRAVVAAGGRAYVVAPAIDADEEEPGGPVSVVALRDELAAALPRIGCGLLHGRLDAATKASAIGAFSRGDAPILVATTVIEVGVDVPQATLMVIVGAERFGLAQLHQLRGRVGRGAAAGECLLLTTAAVSDTARERLAALCDTHDGFVLAEEDLRLRGAGELLGYRQTGPFGFRIANPRVHHDWLEQAHQVSRTLVVSEDVEAQAYRQALRDSWAARMRLARAG